MKAILVEALALVADGIIGLIEWLDPDYIDDIEEETYSNVIKIWGIVDGPFNREDFPEQELDGMDIPENAMAMIVVKVEQSDGKVGQVNLWVGSFNEAYEICKHFDNSIEPLILET
jgi:hypothetical protein